MISADELMLLAFAPGIPAAMKVIVNSTPDELNALYYELFDCDFDPCQNTETCDDLHNNDCGACPFDDFDADDLRVDLQERIMTEIHVKVAQKQTGKNISPDPENFLRLIGKNGIPAVVEMIVNADLETLNKLYFLLARTDDPCNNDRICRYFDGCRGCPFDKSREALSIDLTDRILTEIQARVRQNAA